MWIVCSRNRPGLAQRIFSLCLPTEPGVIAIDDDQTALYANVQFPPGWSLDVSPRNYYGPKNNDVLARHPGKDWYGTMNDDMLPETPGWDSILPKAAGSWGMAWADDRLDRRIGCVAFGGELIRALGWICCPGVKHFYNDDVHETIAHDLAIGQYLPHVVVPHLHFSNGKAARDATYKERPPGEADRQRFEQWKANEWPALRDRIVDVRPR